MPNEKARQDVLDCLLSLRKAQTLPELLAVMDATEHSPAFASVVGALCRGERQDAGSVNAEAWNCMDGLYQASALPMALLWGVLRDRGVPDLALRWERLNEEWHALLRESRPFFKE